MNVLLVGLGRWGEKHLRVLTQLGAKQGDTILEIGCGWGGFAEVAARRGMRVTGITISREQLDYARARLERAGLADRVDLQFRDYRDVEGKYDHIVSIEMIEAVGERYWPDYFTVLKRHVAPGGSALVQAIVIADDFFEGYRSRPDFIQTYIFPGGMLLSPQRLGEQCRRAGLKIAELYSFGLDYAHTLETWLGRFDAVSDQSASFVSDPLSLRICTTPGAGLEQVRCTTQPSTRSSGNAAAIRPPGSTLASGSAPAAADARASAERNHHGTPFIAGSTSVCGPSSGASVVATSINAGPFSAITTRSCGPSAAAESLAAMRCAVSAPPALRTRTPCSRSAASVAPRASAETVCPAAASRAASNPPMAPRPAIAIFIVESPSCRPGATAPAADATPEQL